MHDRFPRGCWTGRVSTRLNRIGTITYYVEVPMDHIAGVEVAETLSNIGKLVTEGYRLGGHNGRDTHEYHLIRIGVVLDVFQ